MFNNNFTARVLVVAILWSSAVLTEPLWAEATPDLVKQADISFGTIDFEGLTGNGNILMGSNGSVIYGQNTSGAGFGTPAQIEITGDAGTTVSISCSVQGSLVLAGHTPIPLDNVRFSIGAANTGTYANDTECRGIGIGSTIHTLTDTASENMIFVGGTFKIDGQPLANGLYSTGNGGTMPQFQILIQ